MAQTTGIFGNLAETLDTVREERQAARRLQQQDQFARAQLTPSQSLRYGGMQSGSNLGRILGPLISPDSQQQDPRITNQLEIRNIVQQTQYQLEEQGIDMFSSTENRELGLNAMARSLYIGGFPQEAQKVLDAVQSIRKEAAGTAHTKAQTDKWIYDTSELAHRRKLELERQGVTPLKTPSVMVPKPEQRERLLRQYGDLIYNENNKPRTVDDKLAKQILEDVFNYERHLTANGVPADKVGDFIRPWIGVGYTQGDTRSPLNPFDNIDSTWNRPDYVTDRTSTSDVPTTDTGATADTTGADAAATSTTTATEPEDTATEQEDYADTLQIKDALGRIETVDDADALLKAMLQDDTANKIPVEQLEALLELRQRLVEQEKGSFTPVTPEAKAAFQSVIDKTPNPRTHPRGSGRVTPTVRTPSRFSSSD